MESVEEEEVQIDKKGEADSKPAAKKALPKAKPKRVPIADDAFDSLTNSQLIHKMTTRKAGVPQIGKDPKLRKRLRETLNKMPPVHLAEEAAKAKKEEWMT